MIHNVMLKKLLLVLSNNLPLKVFLHFMRAEREREREGYTDKYIIQICNMHLP